TGLELVRAQLDGQAPAKITFAETAILHGQNRRRQLVRPQLRRRVPQHPAYLEHDVRREQVSVRYLPRRFGRRAILTLPSVLLQQLVRDQEARPVRCEIHLRGIGGIPVALETPGDGAARSMIGVVLQYRRIQIAAGHETFAADAERVLAL